MIFCMENKVDCDQKNTALESRRGTEKVLLSGVLVIDKEAGISSFGVVLKVRKLLKVKKAGHTGTLDPFATGVLVVCLEQATKIIPYLEEGTKEYVFTIHFGIETDTWDSTGQITKKIEPPKVEVNNIESVVSELIGTVELPVPRFSAVKVSGKRLYKLARKGIEFETPKKESNISKIEMLDFAWPEVTLAIECSKGTYVRSVAKAIGDLLGIPAHVKKLRRLRSGRFSLKNAITIDELASSIKNNTVWQQIMSMSSALDHLPIIRIDKQTAESIRKGGVQAIDLRFGKSSTTLYKHVRVVSGNDDLVAIAEVKRGNSLAITRVFPQTNALIGLVQAAKTTQK
ncbi:MAG: tRNA pseudouridine(55) synthase TruB [Deltaproteobacteria bacterium]|nr:MAG: tRNA pseudouridine(55) synthase TruB [Deltaproteobacteria bacterium]